MASQFASVVSEEIIQINNKAVPKNTNKATKFGLAVFMFLARSLSLKSLRKFLFTNAK